MTPFPDKPQGIFLTQEKLSMFREAQRYHTAKDADHRTHKENEWLQWVPSRLETLERELND